MLFQSSQIVLAITTISSLMAVASAVDLRQYNQGSCNGNRRQCTNIGQNACCRSETRNFVSSSCINCNSRAEHRNYEKAGENFCGFRVASSRGGSNNCLGGGAYNRGHAWSQLSFRRSAGEEVCTESVEADLVEVSGRWFQVNGTMTKEQKERLDTLWAAEVAIASIPTEFDEFEVTVNDE